VEWKLKTKREKRTTRRKPTGKNPPWAKPTDQKPGQRCEGKPQARKAAHRRTKSPRREAGAPKKNQQQNNVRTRGQTIFRTQTEVLPAVQSLAHSLSRNIKLRATRQKVDKPITEGRYEPQRLPAVAKPSTCSHIYYRQYAKKKKRVRRDAVT